MKYDIDINETLSNVFESFENGDIDGIDAFLYAKKLDEVVKGIRGHEDIKQDCFDEVDKYGKGEKCTRNGASFKTSIRRNFKVDFPYINSFKEKIKGIEAQSKALLSSGTPSSFIPDENGEQQEIKAATVTYSSTVSVTLPKNN